MLMRTRNELLVVLGVVLIGGTAGASYFRLRAQREAEPSSVPPSQGTVHVTMSVVEGDRCPSANSWTVSPLRTSVGGWIDVGVTATDPDPGEKVTYSWKPAERFEQPTQAATRFRCDAPGRRSFTAEVSDDHRPTPCVTRLAFTVDCAPR